MFKCANCEKTMFKCANCEKTIEKVNFVKLNENEVALLCPFCNNRLKVETQIEGKKIESTLRLLED